MFVDYRAIADEMFIDGNSVVRHPQQAGQAPLAVLDRLATIALGVVPGYEPRRFVMRTLKLIELRARWAGRPRPSGFTLSRWYHPVARKAGRLDLKRPVSGSAKDMPLREALQKLLGPAGITFTVRDEVVLLTPKPKAPEKK